MVGIISYGAYIPFYRLSRDEIARAWGGGAIRGEKAVANFDEDSLTMAVEAAISCLVGIDRQTIDALYFASTTSPYREKQVAATIAAATDLRREVLTGDFAGSLRGGTIGMRAALDAVEAGSAKKVLVTASDCRLGTPGSDFEQVFGDGAAAIAIGDSGVIATIEGSYSRFDEIVDLWRTESDDFVKSWEDRFVITEGYTYNLQQAISGIMQKHHLEPKDFAKVVFYAPDARRHLEMARKLGFDPKSQVQDGMFDRLGNTGAAFALMMLVAALEEAKPGDRILLASYGDGCDAYVLRVTEEIGQIKARRAIKAYLASKKMLPNYERFVRNRKLMEVEVGRRRPTMASSAVTLWRDRKMVYGLYGSRCTRCGRLFLPPQRVCLYCQAKDEYELVRLSEMKGKLYSFCKDELAASVDPPTILSIVNLEGDCRFYGPMTDRDPDQVEVDMPLELTFRKMHDGEGYHNYFWKCRPAR